MRITIVQGPFLPVPPIMGGAMEKFFYPLGSALAARGHTVTHISCAHPDLPLRQTLHNVHHIRVPSSPAGRNPLLNKFHDFVFADRVHKILPSADILVTNTFFLPLLCRRLRSHGYLHPYIGRTPRGQLSLYTHAAKLLVPSQAVLHTARQQVPQMADKIRIVPLSLPTIPTHVPPRRPLQAPHILLYAGRLHPEKGLHTLLQAIAYLPNSLQSRIELRIAGPHAHTDGGGGDPYLRRLHQLASNTRARVLFLGSITNPQILAAEYAHADLFVYPSLAELGETFGVAPLEALSHGTPILVSDLNCFKDFLRTDTEPNGFVFNHRAADPARELARGLIHALSQGPAWPQISTNAVHTAAHFSLDDVADLLIKEFEHTLAHERA